MFPTTPLPTLDCRYSYESSLVSSRSLCHISVLPVKTVKKQNNLKQS